jgi:hypothetical protein
MKRYESDIESTVADRAMLELGVFSIKLKKTQERGYPDREFLIRGGCPLFIEFKRQGEKPKPYQLMIHERLRHAGYKVEVHDDIEQAMQSIRQAMDAGQGATHGREVAGKPRGGCTLLRSRRGKD